MCVCVPTGKCWPWRDHVLAMLPAHRRQTHTYCHQVQEPQGHGHHWILRCVCVCLCDSLTAAVAENEWSPHEYPTVSVSDKVNKRSAISTAAFCLFQQLLIFNTCNIKTLSANSCRRSVCFNRPLFHFSIPCFPTILISLVKCHIYCALNARVQV